MDKRIRELLDMTKDDPKPNFTQVELRLTSWSAPPAAFDALLEIMEEKFKLPTLESKILSFRSTDVSKVESPLKD